MSIWRSVTWSALRLDFFSKSGLPPVWAKDSPKLSQMSEIDVMNRSSSKLKLVFDTENNILMSANRFLAL